MPVIKASTYRGPFYLRGKHLETIFPGMFVRVAGLSFERQRLELPDSDFLDLDWLKGGRAACLILSHGLEGSSDRYYMKRAARYFYQRGFDVLAWNCRSCSGEMNRLPRFYHHGDTIDLELVVAEAIKAGYEKIFMVGYSMGASMTMKYLGERTVDPRIKGAVGFSVPCHLKDSANQLARRSNRIYENRFLKKLIAKVKIKSLTHPEIDVDGVDAIRDFETFHERFTVPLHGFRNTEDFYSQATCDQFLPGIQVPVLIVNAQNDPILGQKCFPVHHAENSKNVFLEMPKAGGHSGFTLPFQHEYSWMEIRAEQFFREEAGIL